MNSQEIRAPLDVINLAVLMEINQEWARDAIIKNAADVVSHGDVRARVVQGIVRVKTLPRTSTKSTEDTAMKE